MLESGVRACDRVRSGGLDDPENEDITVVLDAFQIIALIADMCCEKLPAPAVSEGGTCAWRGASLAVGADGAQELLGRALAAVVTGAT